MKKFRFRLQKVLEVRESDKKDKKRGLAFRAKELAEAEAHQQSLIDEHDLVKIADGMIGSMAEVALVGSYQEKLREELEEQEKIVQQAIEAVNKAREAYIDSAKEVGALESVKTVRQEEHNYDEHRKDRKGLNEVAIQRYHRRKIGL